MSKHKNLLLITISMILLLYAGFISIFPVVLTSTFNKVKFEEKAYKATGLLTSVGSVEYKIKPNFTMIITIQNWSSKYIDYQDCFEADWIEIYTSPLSIFTKNFPIKEMNLKYVRFSNQLLSDGTNKLAYLPKSFDTLAFGTNKITIGAGPVKVNSFRIKHIAPGFYKEDNRSEEKYSKAEVKDFLDQLDIRNVVVK